MAFKSFYWQRKQREAERALAPNQLFMPTIKFKYSDLTKSLIEYNIGFRKGRSNVDWRNPNSIVGELTYFETKKEKEQWIKKYL